MTAAPVWKCELEEHGFAIVREVLPATVVDDLIEKMTAHPTYALRHLTKAIPAVKNMAGSSAVRALVEPVLGPNPFVVRSLFFDKTPEANWKVAWHQDLTIAVEKRIEVEGFGAWSVKEGIAHVQPLVSILGRVLTVRLHLDNCDATNGALQVIAGSHQAGRLNAEAIARWRATKPLITCAVSRGGALLMKPLLLHASSPARQPKHRRVLHLEFAATPLPGGLRWAAQSSRGWEAGDL